MRILVTGGAGYIGKRLFVEELLASGQSAVVYDNLSQGIVNRFFPAQNSFKVRFWTGRRWKMR